MKYIKVFTQDTDYQTFMGGAVIKPNVSYCRKENEVHYNPLILQPNNEIWYTSTDGTIVTPESTTPFLDVDGNNIKIISNTYEKGKGIIKLKKECKKIGNWAFYGCTSLSSITIPDSVTSIGENAFSGCTSLTGITIPDSVTSIGNYAFEFCDSLSSIILLPETPPTLGTNAFNDIAINAVIYVPSESVDGYKSADRWSDYADIIQPIP